MLSNDLEAELACQEIAEVDKLIEIHFTDDNEMLSRIDMDCSSKLENSALKRPNSRSSSPIRNTRSKNVNSEESIFA